MLINVMLALVAIAHYGLAARWAYLVLAHDNIPSDFGRGHVWRRRADAVLFEGVLLTFVGALMFFLLNVSWIIGQGWDVLGHWHSGVWLVGHIVFARAAMLRSAADLAVLDMNGTVSARLKACCVRSVWSGERHECDSDDC